MKSRFAAVMTIASLVVAMIVVLTLRSEIDLRAQTVQFVETLRAQGNLGLLLLGLAYIPASLLFVPSPLLTISGGFVFGMVRAVIAISLGSTLAASVTFLVGRTLLRQFIEQKVANDARFRALDQAVGQHGFKIVFLSRLSPVLPYNLLNYAFGVTRVRFRDYVLASWSGMFPGTCLYVSIGAAAKTLTEVTSGSSHSSIAQQALFGFGLLATALVSAMLTKIAKKALADVTVVVPTTET
jgi:uncharacterized membrane protein YdjX (TVP38/TMEM64 family)